MWKSILIFLLSIKTVNSYRVLGNNPKTWTPTTELDCTTCKLLLATLETDACLKLPNTECEEFIEKYGAPEKVCQKIGICHTNSK